MTNSTVSTAADSRGTRGRRLKAILAGGLVLGVGAAVTLAAWNDSEFAQGTFTAGAFNLEGSTDGTVYDEHVDAGSAAPLGFTVPAGNLAPGDTVSAPFAVRLDETTTTGADVVISAAPSGGSLAGLTYSLDQTTAFGCDLTGATNRVVAGTAVTAVSGTPTFSLEPGASAAGDAAYFCFTVTADAALVQSQTGTATWQFAAASTD
jgi:predicted ribosomally synthesized peptide with SipW-like signal peptide